MVNDNFQPDESEESVLAVFKRERYPVANPRLLRDGSGVEKADVNRALQRLEAAGWVSRRTRGLWVFETDPRDDPPDPDAVLEESRGTE